MIRLPSLRRILAVARKEFLHLVRDRRTAPIVLVVPIMQLTLLGLAANFDVTDVPTVVVDLDRSAVSRGIATRLDAGEAFDVVSVTGSIPQAEQAMDVGDAEVVVIVPDGTARNLRRGVGQTIPLWVDGTDTSRAIMAQQYVDAILTRTAAEASGSSMADLPVGLPDPRARVLYNPTLQSRWFMVPGVLVMVLTIITVLLGALAIVKERENGTIEQLSVTPIRPIELLVGKLAPFVIVGLIDGLLVCLLAVYGFGVPFRGNVLELFVMVLLYLFSTLGMGLMVSAISDTQQQAMMSTIMVLLPSILMGGVVYPLSNMPGWAQNIAALLPISYFIDIVRGVFLKGIGFETLGYEVLMLTLLGLVFLSIGIFRFRKRSA